MQVNQAIDEDALIDAIATCFDDPLRFVLMAYPWGEPGPLRNEKIDDWQKDLLTEIGAQVKLGESLQGAIRAAIASGHGIGKTALIAWVIQWFISTRRFPQIVVTASTQTQLSSKTWREVAKWHRLLICRHWFEWTATKYYHVDYPETWFATAIPWSQNNADAFSGTHEKYVLIIYDEAQAIADTIWDTTEGALTTPGAIWIVFGNYTKNTGKFHECFAGRTRDRITIRKQIDSRTCSKANQAQIKQWIDDYGEDSDFVKIRVRGIAPKSGADQFIPQDLLDQCLRYKAAGYEHMPKVLVLDVARYGENQSVASVRQGRKFRILRKWRELAIDQLADRFCECKSAPGRERKLLDHLLLDLHHKYLSDETELNEFGCGIGTNLALLAGKIRRLRGFDWSQAAVDKVRARGIDAECFDMFSPPDVELRGAALTVHAMEQLGTDWQPMLDYLVRSRPSIVIHVEPILELYDELDLIDYLHAQYHRKRGYLSGYLPELQRFAQAGIIELLEARRSNFSGLLHDAYSVVVWRCATQ